MVRDNPPFCINVLSVAHTALEVIDMAKKGMKRMQRTHTKPRNEQAAVPELQGKAKAGHQAARPIIAGTTAPSLKVYHTTPFEKEKPISSVYPAIDNDLARDNLENHIPEADLQDL